MWNLRCWLEIQEETSANIGAMKNAPQISQISCCGKRNWLLVSAATLHTEATCPTGHSQAMTKYSQLWRQDVGTSLTGDFGSRTPYWPDWTFSGIVLQSKTLPTQVSFLPPLPPQVSDLHHCPAFSSSRPALLHSGSRAQVNVLHVQASLLLRGPKLPQLGR